MASYNIRGNEIRIKKRGAEVRMMVTSLRPSTEGLDLVYEGGVRGFIDKDKNMIGTNVRGGRFKVKIPQSFITEITREFS